MSITMGREAQKESQVEYLGGLRLKHFRLWVCPRFSGQHRRPQACDVDQKMRYNPTVAVEIFSLWGCLGFEGLVSGFWAG